MLRLAFFAATLLNPEAKALPLKTSALELPSIPESVSPWTSEIPIQSSSTDGDFCPDADYDTTLAFSDSENPDNPVYTIAVGKPDDGLGDCSLDARGPYLAGPIFNLVAQIINGEHGGTASNGSATLPFWGGLPMKLAIGGDSEVVCHGKDGVVFSAGDNKTETTSSSFALWVIGELNNIIDSYNKQINNCANNTIIVIFSTIAGMALLVGGCVGFLRLRDHLSDRATATDSELAEQTPTGRSRCDTLCSFFGRKQKTTPLLPEQYTPPELPPAYSPV